MYKRQGRKGMVGIVIVSHSCKAAEGIRDIAMEMAVSGQKVISAGGTEKGEIGTDAVKISRAVLEANSGEGVVVLADIGSAVMSSALALELIDESIRKNVRIADAPLVEGTVAAVVQASTGAGVNEVIKAAEEAREMRKI